MIKVKRVFMPILLIVYAFSLSGCKESDNDFKRRFLFENGMTINEKTMNNESGYTYYSSVVCPEITGLKNTGIQDSINKEMADYVSSVVSEYNGLLANPEKESYLRGYNDDSLFCSYYSHAYYNNVVCISIKHTKNINGNAESGMKVFRFDLNTGRHLELKDLFSDGVDYKKTLIKAIKAKLLSLGVDDYLSKPLNDIEHYEDFYFNENTLTIVFNSKDNSSFADISALSDFYKIHKDDLGDYYRSMGGYIDNNLIPILISYNKLDYKVNIFDKCYTSYSIYKAESLKKRLIPDYIDTSLPVKEKAVGDITFKVFYFQIDDMENKSLKSKIDSIVQKEIDDFLDDKRLKKIVERYNDVIAASDDHHTTLRLTLKSCGNYVSIIKNKGSGNYIHYVYGAICKCFDIRTGKEIKINDLFKVGYDYASVIDKKIKIDKYGSPNAKAKGFIDLKTPEEFSFFIESDVEEQYLVINFNNEEDIGWGYRIPFSRFQEDMLKIYE